MLLMILLRLEVVGRKGRGVLLLLGVVLEVLGVVLLMAAGVIVVISGRIEMVLVHHASASCTAFRKASRHTASVRHHSPGASSSVIGSAQLKGPRQ